MIRVSVLYPNTAGSRFDFDYYLNHHLPMIEKLLAPNLKQLVVEQGLFGNLRSVPPAFVAISHLTFESVETFLDVFMTHWPTLTGDIPNYTDVEAVVQFSVVKVSRSF